MSGGRKYSKKISIYFFKSDFENLIKGEIELLSKEINQQFFVEGNEYFLPEELFNELLNSMTFMDVKMCDGIGFHKSKGNKIRITLQRRTNDV